MNPDRCDIIIPVWNQLEATRGCVDSVLKYTDYPYRLIMIDNGSAEETRDYLNDLKRERGPDLVLIRNETNLGFVKAVNRGLKESDAAYLCIMNNDTVATDGWLSEMITVMESHPEIGLLNPSSNTSGQVPDKNESIDDYALRIRRFKGEAQELYTCRGFCMILRRPVLEEIGLLDEIYHFGYFDDTDYCKRAITKGFRTARAKAAYVYHRENVSFKELGHNALLFSNNEKIFFEKWGRPIRIGYFINRIDRADRIDDIAVGVAREGHQIIIFIRRGLKWPVTLDHFDIRKCELNRLLFWPLSFYKIWKRRKKKKLDIILTDDRRFGAILEMIKKTHGAQIVIGPDRQGLLELLRRKARQF